MTTEPSGRGAELQLPAERRHADELARLADADQGPRPDGWRLSPRSVRSFVLCRADLGVNPYVLRRRPLVDRCLVTLMSNRGLLLVGDPAALRRWCGLPDLRWGSSGWPRSTTPISSWWSGVIC